MIAQTFGTPGSWRNCDGLSRIGLHVRQAPCKHPTLSLVYACVCLCANLSACAAWEDSDRLGVLCHARSHDDGTDS